MKKGEKAEFKLSWWKGSQPKGMQSAGRLEVALKLYENALVRLKKDADADALKNLEAALDGVETAAKAAIAEAGKAKNNPEMEWTAQSLGKLDYASERKAGSALVEDDDEGGLLDEDAYKLALRKSLRKLDGGPMNFGFVAGKKGPQHRMVLHRSKNGRAMAAAAMKELDLHLSTFGVASVMPDRDGVIGLTLEGKNIPGLAKKVRLMLKSFKPLPYKDAALFVDGAEVADEHDPADEDEVATDDAVQTAAPPPPPPPPTAAPVDAAALKARLTALVQRIGPVIAADPSRKDALLGLAKQAQIMLGTNNFQNATARIDELEAALAAPAGAAAAPASGSVAYAKSRLAWQATTKRVAADIARLRAALEEVYGDHVQAAAIVGAFDARTAGVLAAFDEDLADRLDAATNAADAASRQALVAEARAAIDRYQAFLDGENLISELDDNPFVKLSIRATVGGTLTALAAAVH